MCDLFLPGFIPSLRLHSCRGRAACKDMPSLSAHTAWLNKRREEQHEEWAKGGWEQKIPVQFDLAFLVWEVDVCTSWANILGFNFMLHLAAAMAQRNITRLPNYRCSHNPVRRNRVSLDLEMFLHAFWCWSEFKKEVCNEEKSSQVCLRDGRPCSDWFVSEGREGFSKTEDRRWEIPDSCPDVYKSPSPWILLRLTTIISAGMAQSGIWRGARDETGEGSGRGERKWERGEEGWGEGMSREAKNRKMKVN